MLNIFTKPFERETLDDWAKLSVDVAKVAILAIPVILYGEKTLLSKFGNIFLLSCIAYSALAAGRKFRQIKKKEEA